jgi:hypothetical protein
VNFFKTKHFLFINTLHKRRKVLFLLFTLLLLGSLFFYFFPDTVYLRNKTYIKDHTPPKNNTEHLGLPLSETYWFCLLQQNNEPIKFPTDSLLTRLRLHPENETINCCSNIRLNNDYDLSFLLYFSGNNILDSFPGINLDLDDAFDDIHLLQADSHNMHKLPDHNIITQNNSKYIGTENNFLNLGVFLNTFLRADNNLFLYNKITMLPNHRANPKTDTITFNNPALPGCQGSCKGIA